MNDLLRKFLEQFNRFTPADIDLIIENTTIETFRKGDFRLKIRKWASRKLFAKKGIVYELFPFSS